MEGVFVGRPGHPHGEGRHRGPGVLEGLHGDVEALSLLAQPVLDRHRDVLQDHVAGVAGPHAHLILFLARRKARRVPLDDEGGDAPMAQIGVDGGEDGVQVGDAAVGDEALLTVEHVVIPPAHGGGTNRRRVGASLGLGKREATQPHLRLVAEPGDVAGLLRLGARDHDGDRSQPSANDGGTDAHTPPGKFLDHQAGGQDARHAAATVLLGIPVGHEADLARLLHHRPGHLVSLVVLGGDGADLPFGKPVGQLAHLLLLVAQLEVDHRASSYVVTQGVQTELG